MNYSAAKYKMIKQSIKSNILEGLITPHQKIQSESQLMSKYKVSRHTVRLAIGELVNEGWLYREQGAGTFCADRGVAQLTGDNFMDKNIAIVTTFISEYIFPSIIRGAESYLSEWGYNVSIFNTNNQYSQEKKILSQILSSNYAGVIIEPTHSATANPNLGYYLSLEKEKVPYVMINAAYKELEPISFSLDDVKGGFLQTKHLIELGHRDIVCIYKTDDSQGRDRLKGYIKAHREYNILLNPKNIITYQTENEDHKPTHDLKELLKGKINSPTAVVCYNDQLVMKLLDFLRGEGLKIPEDLSFVGYDDSVLAELSEVKLTSVIHPKSELGRDAAKAIIQMIQRNSLIELGENRTKLYEPELRIRHSTAPLNKDLAI
ncbi:GntR family transcriptional regulator [Gracilibacillus xinjiangensis]|uniref:GntR family transcriptional regulator n=1 Tax=Gracilibacillus xinjiangensis TaxID=1193282 RepID=A0ABV8WTA5_9BACI